MTAGSRQFRWALVLTLVVVIGAGGWLAWRGIAVRSAIPARPAIESLRAELADELSAAEKKARGFLHPREGLVQLSRLYHANGHYPETLQCYTKLERLQPRAARWLVHGRGGRRRGEASREARSA